jgi:isocitrate/isopropylmalate dehydrogenase
MMLDYIGETEKAKKIEKALASVINKGKTVTRDINKDSYVGTMEFADAVIKELNGQ